MEQAENKSKNSHMRNNDYYHFRSLVKPGESIPFFTEGLQQCSDGWDWRIPHPPPAA
jgi:hypothetical protein